MLRALGLDALVPDAQSAYRPLVHDAFAFFVARLGGARRASIMAEQLSLPASTPAHRRLGLLLRRSPTLHKLGQILARDPRLPAELRTTLQELETMAPATPVDAVRARVRAALPGVRGLRLGRPLAEASVAVVVPFTRAGGRDRDAVHGVLKVLRPGVEESLREDLEIWADLSVYLEGRCADLGLPPLEFRATFDSLRGLLANEVVLEHEQRHLSEAAEFYAGDDAVVIPALLPFCAPDVTAMTRIDGVRVTDARPPAGARRLAEGVVDALLAAPFWCADPGRAPFHADPHAGNLMVTADARLAILDWALVTRLRKEQNVAVVQAVLGAVTQDERRTLAALEALGDVADAAAVRDAVRASLAQVRRGRAPGFGWLTDLMDAVGVSGALRYPRNLALFRKNVLTLSGVVADVSPGVDVDAVMLRRVAREAARESWVRNLAPAWSRDSALHVSQADVWGLMASTPLVASRYWASAWRGLLDGGRRR